MIREFINYHFMENKNKYLFFILVFILGIIIGGVSIYFLSSTQLDELKNYIGSFFELLTKDTSSIDSKKIFNQTMYSDIKIYIFLIILGLSAISILYSISIIFYKGFLFGFVITFFISSYGFKGILFLICVLIIPNIIKNFALMFAFVMSSCFKSSIQKNNKNKYGKVRNSSFYFRYTIYIVVAFLFNVIGICFESYVAPMLMVLFSSSFL